MNDYLPLNPDKDRLAQFGLWFAEAAENGTSMPEAAGLATVSSEGRPVVRMVLLKGISGDGLMFFTNYTSRKARHLQVDPALPVDFWVGGPRCAQTGFEFGNRVGPRSVPAGEG